MKPTVVCACLLAAGLGLLAAAPAARAQRVLTQQFAASTVLLTSGDTLRGPLTLYADRDVLVVRQPDQSLRTVAAGAVAAFAVHDEQPVTGRFLAAPDYVETQPDSARPRVFHSLRWNHGYEYADYCAPAFFEQLSAGPVALLRRQLVLERPAALDPLDQAQYTAWLPGAGGPYVALRSQFFLRTPEGKVLALRCPRRHLLAYFRAEAAAIERYARANDLGFQTSQELAAIVGYANALRQRRAPQ
jgi:hypothetical protein